MPTIADPIIELPDAKAFLSIDGVDQDDKLTQFIATASQMIVNRIGVVSGSPVVSEWHDGGSQRIVLRNQGPIVSVTTVTESFGSIGYTLTQVILDSGAVGDSYSYSVDLDRGVLVRRANGIATAFAAGVQNIHVTYVAGYTTVPEDIKHAAMILTKHLWNSQRGPRPSSAQPTPPFVSGHFPFEVEEILNQYSVPGIA